MGEKYQAGRQKVRSNNPCIISLNKSAALLLNIYFSKNYLSRTKMQSKKSIKQVKSS
jgi:hypothetical protein